LHADQSNQNPVHVLGYSSIQLHIVVAVIKLDLESLVGCSGIQSVNRLIASDSFFLVPARYRRIVEEVRSDREVIVGSAIYEDPITTFEQQTQHVGLLKSHSEVDSHFVLGQLV